MCSSGAAPLLLITLLGCLSPSGIRALVHLDVSYPPRLVLVRRAFLDVWLLVALFLFFFLVYFVHPFLFLLYMLYWEFLDGVISDLPLRV